MLHQGARHCNKANPSRRVKELTSFVLLNHSFNCLVKCAEHLVNLAACVGLGYCLVRIGNHPNMIHVFVGGLIHKVRGVKHVREFS